MPVILSKLLFAAISAKFMFLDKLNDLYDAKCGSVSIVEINENDDERVANPGVRLFHDIFVLRDHVEVPVSSTK